MEQMTTGIAVPEVGEVYEGTVRSIMPYGCFVEILPGKDGLLHISEIDWKRLETVESAGIKEGDKITVKLLEIDPKTGKYKLSHRVLIPKPEGYQERERRPANAVTVATVVTVPSVATVVSAVTTATTITTRWPTMSPATSTTRSTTALTSIDYLID